MRQDALSELSKNLDDKYEAFVKELATNTDKTIESIAGLEPVVNSNIDRANDAMNGFLRKYSKNLTMEMATGTSSLVTKINQVATNDLNSTAKMEKEKAAKLEAYEIAKQTAYANHEAAQQERQNAIKNLINTFSNNQSSSNDQLKSELTDLNTSNNNIKDALDTLDETVKAKLTQNDKSITEIVGDASSAINNAITDYTSKENPLHKTISDISTKVSDLNNMFSQYLNMNLDSYENAGEEISSWFDGFSENVYEDFPNTYTDKNGNTQKYDMFTRLAPGDYKLSAYYSDDKEATDTNGNAYYKIIGTDMYMSDATREKYGLDKSFNIDENHEISTKTKASEEIKKIKDGNYKLVPSLKDGKVDHFVLYAYDSKTKDYTQRYSRTLSNEALKELGIPTIGGTKFKVLNKKVTSKTTGTGMELASKDIYRQNETKKEFKDSYNITRSYDNISDLAAGEYSFEKVRASTGEYFNSVINNKTGKATGRYISDELYKELREKGTIASDGKLKIAGTVKTDAPTSSVLSNEHHVNPQQGKTFIGRGDNKTHKYNNFNDLAPGEYYVTGITTGKDNQLYYDIADKNGLLVDSSMSHDVLNALGLSLLNGKNKFTINSSHQAVTGGTKSTNGSNITVQSNNSNGGVTTSSSYTNSNASQEQELLIYDPEDGSGDFSDTVTPLQEEGTAILTAAKKLVSGPTNNSLRNDARLMDTDILKAFEDLGFKYVIDENFKLGEGYFNAKTRTITVTKAGSQHLYHELGHFLAFIAGNVDTSSRFKQIYNDEKSKFKGTYRGYAGTSSAEFFAECVREYILHNSQLKSWCPQAYSFVGEAINKITPEQIAKVYKTYGKIWEAYGGYQPQLSQYASGTLHAKKGIAEVFEGGPEIITTKKGTFVPFEGGEGVIPAEQTKTLMNLANAFNNGKLGLQMPDMSGYQVPNISSNTNYNNNIHFDSLITINGNADSTTVEQMKDIVQGLINNRQFGEQMTKIVSKRQASDGRMAGKRISVI